MLVIKQKYEQAIPILKRLYDVALGAKVEVVEISGKQTSFRNSNKMKKEKDKER